jgi:hypothetical protein
MANTHRLLSKKDCDYYVMRLDALPKKFDQVLDGLKVREQNRFCRRVLWLKKCSRK